ncbi:MAG: HAMP domain-containing histidine kinase [Planctomycetes bacterium]|nr:HAMP domain-containing histidine kinase [Planctomycetota bacterium]
MLLSQSPSRAASGRAGIYSAVGIGILAAVVLTWVAWGPLIQPDQIGKRKLENLRIEAEENIARSWNKLRMDPALIDEVLKPNWYSEVKATVWQTASNDLPPSNDEWKALRQEKNPNFDLLFAESEKQELEIGDIAAAISACRDALGIKPDPVRNAEGNLRLLQLLLKANDVEGAIRQWEALLLEQDGRQTVNGFSILALGYLAIGYSGLELPDSLLGQTQRKLTGAFVNDRIHLPTLSIRYSAESSGEDIKLATDLDSVIVQERLLTCPFSSDSLKSAIREYFERRILRSLIKERKITELPSGLRLYPNNENTVCILNIDESEKIGIGTLQTQSTFTGLSEFWRDEGSLPEGYEVEIGLATDISGSELRSTFDLPASSLRAQVWANDPQSIYRQAARPVLFMRWGLTLLGLLCAVTGFTIFRAMERQRRLQSLKTDFIASVSHELRTPISSILLMAENLEHGRVGNEESVARYHQLIKREAQRLRRLIADILDFSRMDRGRKPAIKLALTDLAEWAQELTVDLKQWATDHQVTLELHGQLKTQNHEIDSDALRRAVLNLADNGLRHSGSNQFEVTFSQTELNAIIEFRDFGSGIVPGNEEKIFEPFQQSESKSVKGKGAGLGLAIVSEIVGAHGGEVTAANADGGGAVFKIILPLPASELPK